MTTTPKSYHSNPLVSDAMLRAGTTGPVAGFGEVVVRFVVVLGFLLLLAVLPAGGLMRNTCPTSILLGSDRLFHRVRLVTLCLWRRPILLSVSPRCTR